MLSADREALLCDFAEYYHVYDFRSLPVMTLAALAVGLRDDSRIKMKISGLNAIPEQVLLVAIADKLALIHYYLTADKTTPAPVLFRDLLVEDKNQRETGFATPEEFNTARAKFLEKVENNG